MTADRLREIARYWSEQGYRQDYARELFQLADEFDEKASAGRKHEEQQNRRRKYLLETGREDLAREEGLL